LDSLDEGWLVKDAADVLESIEPIQVEIPRTQEPLSSARVAGDAFVNDQTSSLKQDKPTLQRRDSKWHSDGLRRAASIQICKPCQRPIPSPAAERPGRNPIRQLTCRIPLREHRSEEKTQLGTSPGGKALASDYVARDRDIRIARCAVWIVKRTPTPIIGQHEYARAPSGPLLALEQVHFL
jgi:hypothetical protein